jgi:hypothetical protein
MPGMQAIESIRAAIVGFMCVSSFSASGAIGRGPKQAQLVFFAWEALLPQPI